MKKKFDFSEEENLQDMVWHIMQDKKLDEQGALLFAIDKKFALESIENPWADYAISLWGHADPNWQKHSLDNPIIEIDLDDEKLEIIESVEQLEKINTFNAVAHLITFAVGSLGYHL